MTVYLQSATGNVLSVYVDATSENRATGKAERTVNRENPGKSYRALRVEHGRAVIR